MVPAPFLLSGNWHIAPSADDIKDGYDEDELIEDKDEGGFVVSYPELPGCVTCSETIEGAIANALDAKKTWLEAALEEGIEI